jgi:hypothetical protein
VRRPEIATRVRLQEVRRLRDARVLREARRACEAGEPVDARRATVNPREPAKNLDARRTTLDPREPANPRDLRPAPALSGARARDASPRAFAAASSPGGASR